jgi:phage terminase large subunit GpA-like protein
MTIVESSPSRPVENVKWIPSTPHEAPPAGGIIALYNRGDRRRWYWPCPHCWRYFEGRFEMLDYEVREGMTNLEIGETATMVCPFCGVHIHPEEREEMQSWGLWLKDGQGIDKEGRVFGPGRRTNIASFWLRGVAATFISWKRLVASYLDAQDDFERTGSEEALKKFYNNDLGEPYYSRHSMEVRVPEALKSRAENLGERVVPEGVRFLIATCDVQKNMWIVQVFGILPGKPFDMVMVDRFDVRKSQRTDEDGDALWVKPHTYLEDWKELIENVIEKEYPLGDDSGRMMRIRQVGCDSGGKAGVTTMAYNFYRYLRENNLHRRFILVKGEASAMNPRARITYPDSNRRDLKSAARGDVPVLLLNSNMLKDDLDGRLDCTTPGNGMYRFPNWLPDSFYNELCSEVRTEKGWEQTKHERNEAFDLSYYCIGICISELLKIEHIDWNNPPTWAKEWDKNELVREGGSEKRFAKPRESAYDFKSLAESLA